MILNELEKSKLMKNGKIFAVIVLLYIVSLIITQVKTWGTLRPENSQMPTISVSGTADVYAVPDVAELRASIVGETKDKAGSTAKQAEIKQKVLAVMKEFNIAEKDYKTEYITTNPKYEWQRAEIYCITTPCPQPEGRNVVTGYTTDESFIIKVRNIDDAGKVYDALVKAGIQNVSGPNMMIDDEQAVIAQARAKAIDDAKAKAKILAKDLGVKTVRIVSFNENTGGYPQPMYDMSSQAVSMKVGAMPETIISKGENKITANVNIIYEIK
jgi:uncharacterized protein